MLSFRTIEEASVGLFRYAMHGKKVRFRVRSRYGCYKTQRMIFKLMASDAGTGRQGDFWDAEINGILYDSFDNEKKSNGWYYATLHRQQGKKDFAKMKKANKIMKAAEARIKESAHSDYEIIRAVNDYLVALVEYDYDDHLRSHYYWTAFINHSVQCDGYAGAFYKMLRDLGVGCRMIYSEDHAFNLVRCDGRWYWSDCCWSDGGEVSDDQWFLKGEKHFPLEGHHLPTMKYRKQLKSYNISYEDYSTV